ncbi:MAG: outer membrane protein assembly factor BamB [Halioglobus sp.]|jgi:outer membrane protein assembly factor BamB
MRPSLSPWRLIATLVLLSTLSACGTIDTVGGWFSSDDEDPRKPVELEDIEQQVTFKKLWSKGIGDGQGEGLYKLTPVIDRDRIFAASSDGVVVSHDRHSGKELWERELEVDLSGGVGKFEDSLFVGTSEGYVTRLSAEDGSEIWSTRLQGEVLAAPQGDGKVVIAQTYDGRLQGLDFSSGKKLWVHDSNVPVLTVRGTSTPILSNGVVYAGFANGRVLAFNAQTGTISWEARVAISQGRSEIERIVDVDGTMALIGSELFAASYQGRLVGIDISNGRKIWQQDASSYSGVSQGFGNIYISDESGALTAYLRNGQGIRWEQGALGFRNLSRPTPVNSYVAVADFEGYVHLVSQVDGEFVGRIKTDGDGVRADMIGDGNILYVYGNSGKLFAFEISSKE